jgi:hypothetical protein
MRPIAEKLQPRKRSLMEMTKSLKNQYVLSIYFNQRETIDQRKNSINSGWIKYKVRKKIQKI